MLRCLLFAILVAWGCQGESLAQTIHQLQPLESVQPEDYVKVTVLAVHPGATIGGYGYIRCVLKNPGSIERTIGLKLGDSGRRGKLILVEKNVKLASGATAVHCLPFPCSGKSGSLRMSIGGVERAVQNFTSGRVGKGIHELCISEQSDYRVRAETLIRSSMMSGLSMSDASWRIDDSLVCRPIELPPHWHMLSGFDLVSLDGECPGLGLATQTMLCQFVRGGGSLLVTSAAALPKGPLLDFIARRREPGATGFGRVYGDMGTLAKVPVASTGLSDWLASTPHAPMMGRKGDVSGPAPKNFYAVLPVPGVAGLPTNVFFLIIFLFVFIIGPVNHILLRRRGKPWLVLITVPASGFVVTASILGYAVLREGFVAQAIVHSVTILDQRDHRASSVSARTLFVGLSPSYLTPDTSSYLFAATQLDPSIKTASYHLDLDRQQIDGAILPSRRPANFVHASTKTCRERLQIQLTKLRYRSSSGLNPISRKAAVVMRDKVGVYYVSDGDESMKVVGPSRAKLILSAYIDEFNPIAKRGERVKAWLGSRLGSELAPGTYLGLFEAAPVPAELGLKEVVYNRKVNLVLGILAEKDIQP